MQPVHSRVLSGNPARCRLGALEGLLSSTQQVNPKGVVQDILAG